MQAVLDEFGPGPYLEARVTSRATGRNEDDIDIDPDDYSDSDSETDEDTRDDGNDKHDVPSCGIYRVNNQARHYSRFRLADLFTKKYSD